MSDHHYEQHILAFSEAEMLQFGADAVNEISQEELRSRKGIEVDSVAIDVELDIKDEFDLPLGVENKFGVGFSLYGDKLNPTQLIVDGEFEPDYFRINRPSNLKDLKAILEDWERNKRNSEI